MSAISPKHLRRDRIGSIDFVRGFAMVLVILDHSFQSTNPALIHYWLHKIITLITALAAIAFIAISGTIYSYFLYASDRWMPVYRRYAKRAAFLLLLVHPTINLMDYFWQLEGVADPLSFSTVAKKIVIGFPITDTIAVCILVSPLLIVCVSNWVRVGIIVGMLAVSRIVSIAFNPETLGAALIKEVFFGVPGDASVFWFPLIPWLAVFLAGSLIAQYLVRLKSCELNTDRLAGTLQRIGTVLLLSSGVLASGCWLLKKTLRLRLSESALLCLSAHRLSSLLPAYLGVLVFLLSVMFRFIDAEGRYNRLTWMVCVFGRISLFVYVGQFAVVKSVPALLGLKGLLGLIGFIFLFVICLTVMWAAAYWYGRLRSWISKNDYQESVEMAMRRSESA